MAKYIIDLVFDENSGDVKLTIDFNDPSLTQFELIDAIRSGEVRDDVLDQVTAVFGEELAGRVRSGEVEMVCLDDHPELRDGSAVAEPQQTEISDEQGREHLQ